MSAVGFCPDSSLAFPGQIRYHFRQLAWWEFGQNSRAGVSNSMVVVGKQCLNIRGRDVFILSGAFHYARCPKALWRDRLARMQEAGLSCIDYYIPWNYHEREKPSGLDDFSKIDLSELEEFLSIVHDEFGFYSMARPGPYICAEWHGGGFPWWLLLHRPSNLPSDQPWIRTDDPTYLAWSKHWYDAVCPIIAREQLTKKRDDQGGVILFQIENEYDFYSGPTEAQRVNHLKALANDARRNGIEIPLMTCWTKQCRSNPDPVLKDVFDGPNMYPRWNMAAVEERLIAVKQQQPNAPGMVPELQGGWFSGVGGALSEDQPNIDADQIHHLTLMAMAHDATILNYYMFFGGTNFDTWAGRRITTSYDYNAPLRENGEVGDRFYAVKAIGEMLKQHGEAIAGSTKLDVTITGLVEGVSVIVREARCGDWFIFVRNATTELKDVRCQLAHRDSSSVEVSVELASRGFKVLYLPSGSLSLRERVRVRGCTDTDDLLRRDTKRKELGERSAPETHAPSPQPSPKGRGSRRLSVPQLPVPVRIGSARTMSEPFAGEWINVAAESSLVEHGIYDARYVAYRTSVFLSETQLTQFDSLWIDLHQDDHIVLKLNGQLIFPAGNYCGGPAYDIRSALRAGRNEFVFLYENRGYIHFGVGLESLCGIRSVLLTNSDHLSLPLMNWQAKLLDGLNERDVAHNSFDDADWPAFTLDPVMADRLACDLQPGTETEEDFAARVLFSKKTKAVYRSTFVILEADLRAGKTRLVCKSIDQPTAIYLNGNLLMTTENKSTALSLDLSQSLRAGSNTLAFIVDNVRGFQAGLMFPLYLEGKEIAGQALPLHLLDDLTGVKRKWYLPEHATDSWQAIPLDTTIELSKRGHAGTSPVNRTDDLAIWYRMEFELPQSNPSTWIPWRALIDASGNGLVYLNGRCIGRYWEAGPQREYFLPECWLNFGDGKKNTLALCLRSTPCGAKLRAVEVRPYEDHAELR